MTVLELMWTREEVLVQRCGSAPLWSLQIKALKLFTREDLLSWFLEHRNSSRKLSVHVRALIHHTSGLRAQLQRWFTSVSLVAQVVGFGGEEDPPEEEGAPSPAYGEVSQLTFLPARSPALQDATLITDIRAFTSSLHLHPHHKILS